MHRLRNLQSCMLAYGAPVVLCAVALVWVLRLWRADLSTPLCYTGDGLLYTSWIRSVLDQGWYLSDPRLGAPDGMDMRDFPLDDNLHFFLLKLLGLLAPNAPLCYNLYYLLTFPLAAISALIVLRRWQISYLPAVVCSLLYAFLPYHFFRLGHLFLASYYLVPLFVLLLVRLHGGARFAGKGAWGWTLAAVLVCLLVSSAGIYYAFFACFFLLVVGLHAGLQRLSLRPVGAAAFLLAVLVTGVAINLLPHLVHRFDREGNPAAVPRAPFMAEYFGLKPAQLLLPASLHRLGFLARFKQRYNATAPLVNENDSSSLGFVAGAGFLVLIGRLFWQQRDWARPGLLDTLALLTLAALALAVVGGGGTFFSYLVSAKIRAYNRICVYLAFFALAAVAWCLDRLAWTRRPAVLAALLFVGLADQTSPAFIPSAATRERFQADADYFQAIGKALPAGSMIFQLPFVAYPEATPIHRLEDHDHLRAYLHTRTLRWSHGTMKGTAPERWQQHVASRPPEEMVRLLTGAGFAGIYVNRLGYVDGAADLERTLTQLLGSPMTSSDGQMLFFFLARTSGPSDELRLGKRGS
jgi:phosphoglycerol transferase